MIAAVAATMKTLSTRRITTTLLVCDGPCRRACVGAIDMPATRRERGSLTTFAQAGSKSQDFQPSRNASSTALYRSSAPLTPSRKGPFVERGRALLQQIPRTPHVLFSGSKMTDREPKRDPSAEPGMRKENFAALVHEL